MKGWKFVDDEVDVIHTASGWLRTRWYFFYNGMRVFEKRWTKCVSVGGDYLHIFCCLLCQATNFWTPLVLQQRAPAATFVYSRSTNKLHLPAALYHISVCMYHISTCLRKY